MSFRRGGVEVFSSTTFAGFVGTFTATRQGSCTVAINYRQPPDDEGPLPDTAAWPVGFLVRHLLQQDAILTQATQATHAATQAIQAIPSPRSTSGGDQDSQVHSPPPHIPSHPAPPSYTSVLRGLSESVLWAGCYVCVAGLNANEGCVVARSESGVVDRFSLEDSGGRPLVQANFDRGAPEEACDPDCLARVAAVRAVYETGEGAEELDNEAAGDEEKEGQPLQPQSQLLPQQQEVDKTEGILRKREARLWRALRISPVCSADTVYASVACADTSYARGRPGFRSCVFQLFSEEEGGDGALSASTTLSCCRLCCCWGRYLQL